MVDTSTVVKGLFYGRGTTQLMAQAISCGAVTLSTSAASFMLMCAVKSTGTLRVSREGELEGLDLHEHGMVAYPGYVIHGYEPTPGFAPKFREERTVAAPQSEGAR